MCPLADASGFQSSISPATEDPLAIGSGQRTTGPLWQWTPEADYQAAVCLVRCGHAQMSGGYVKFGELTGVITAKHGIEGTSADVIFSDGSKQTGSAYVDKDGNDVAFVAVVNEKIAPLELAPSLDVGATVEYVTLGGPESKLRHFAGTVVGGFSDQVRIHAHVISGDSGAPILNAQHQVATVQSCGLGKFTKVATAGGGQWTVYDESTAPPNAAVLAFMQRVHDRLYPTGNVNVLCFGGRCQQGAAPQPPAAASPLYPPKAAAIPGPQSPVPSPQLSNQPVLNRLDALEQNLAAKLDKLPIPLGSQLDAVQKKIDALPFGSQLADVQQKLDAAVPALGTLHQKVDAALPAIAAMKQKFEAFDSSAIGQTVKPLLDQALAPIAAKVAAPIAADLGLPALATIGVAGGIPGLIGSVLLGLFLKKKQ